MFNQYRQNVNLDSSEKNAGDHLRILNTFGRCQKTPVKACQQLHVSLKCWRTISIPTDSWTRVWNFISSLGCHSEPNMEMLDADKSVLWHRNSENVYACKKQLFSDVETMCTCEHLVLLQHTRVPSKKPLDCLVMSIFERINNNWHDFSHPIT